MVCIGLKCSALMPTSICALYDTKRCTGIAAVKQRSAALETFLHSQICRRSILRKAALLSMGHTCTHLQVTTSGDCRCGSADEIEEYASVVTVCMRKVTCMHDRRCRLPDFYLWLAIKRLKYVVVSLKYAFQELSLLTRIVNKMKCFCLRPH